MGQGKDQRHHAPPLRKLVWSQPNPIESRGFGDDRLYFPRLFIQESLLMVELSYFVSLFKTIFVMILIDLMIDCSIDSLGQLVAWMKPIRRNGGWLGVPRGVRQQCRLKTLPSRLLGRVRVFHHIHHSGVRYNLSDRMVLAERGDDRHCECSHSIQHSVLIPQPHYIFMRLLW